MARNKAAVRRLAARCLTVLVLSATPALGEPALEGGVHGRGEYRNQVLLPHPPVVAVTAAGGQARCQIGKTAEPPFRRVCPHVQGRDTVVLQQVAGMAQGCEHGVALLVCHAGRLGDPRERMVVIHDVTG